MDLSLNGKSKVEGDENMFKYDTYINSLADLPEGKEIKLSVRDLAPGKQRFAYKHVMAMVSADSEKYPDKMQVRFGRGQLHSEPYSIQVIKEVNIVPERYL
jgi:phenylphosphate carboxylase gamma subunit